MYLPDKIIVYGKTLEELCQKYDEAEHRTENDLFNRRSPTVKEYCEKWLLLQSANVRATTLIDYTYSLCWVGHTKAWIIPGTEDLRPYIPVTV